MIRKNEKVYSQIGTPFALCGPAFPALLTNCGQMATQKRKKPNHGHAVSYSFTLDELDENVSTVAIDRVSTDGRRVYRSTKHIVPSPKKIRLEDELADAQASGLIQPDWGSLGLRFGDEPVDSEQDEEIIKPRAKRYLSSVHIFEAPFFSLHADTLVGQPIKRMAAVSGRVSCGNDHARRAR